MRERTWLIFLGAVLLVGAASVVSAAPRPGAAQPSSTSAKKKKVSSKSKKKGKVKGQTAPTVDRIKEIQAALQKDGSYAGEPTGKWDGATEDAMKKFQDKNGFAPTGKIDALSLGKLGLGSDTAGKAAPKAPATPVLSPAKTNAPSTTTSVAPADPPAK